MPQTNRQALLVLAWAVAVAILLSLLAARDRLVTPVCLWTVFGNLFVMYVTVRAWNEGELHSYRVYYRKEEPAIFWTMFWLTVIIFVPIWANGPALAFLFDLPGTELP